MGEGLRGSVGRYVGHTMALEIGGMPDPGPIIRGLDNVAYHSGPGLSYSGVKRLARTPLHFHALAEPHEGFTATPSAAMFAGTLAHCATLEPDQFDARYPQGPEVATRAAREWKAFCADHPGAEPVTRAQREIAFAQAASLRAHPVVAELLRAGEPEISVYWRDPPTGILCKCRPDWVHRCGTTARPAAILLDVKTCQDASAQGFAKSVANFGYHGQADWYCTGFELATGIPVQGMVFAAVESEFPYAAAAFMVDDTAMSAARERNRRALISYQQCERAQSWPGYPTDLQVISLPAWGL